MKSKRSHEGYLMLDHRDAPGLEPAEARHLPPGAGKGFFECPTITCSHCQQVLVVNPLRTRERAYCRGCDHYICDRCAAVLTKTGKCRTFKQIIEERQEAAEHGQTLIIG